MAAKEDLNLGKGNGAGDADKASGGGKGKLIAIIAVVVVLLGGGGAAAFLLLGNNDDAATEVAGAEPAAPKVEEREAAYMPLEKFLVNFDHKGGMRYIQTDIQLMAYEPAALENAQRNMPAVRNRLIMLLSDQDFDALRTVEGKETLRQDVLKAVNEVLKLSGQDAVQDVYFTSFVLQ
ncbi:MAG: flagellar basal body protein FliL [Haliea sp.]|uniref:flagellar basal body-associated FliL family protein n=1 Tax=Haliea sp. TaxID=1932666 RepID=UPI000C4FA2D3|nr:flagellar basal body-associated FliL family protein [Haliea sp.]MBM70498.1 flagellar basal body protein FliL [Haliea sp.]|tara:strand:+ start:292 stop:825 length:534 start_codon:yes stop_codon:yes gene_type:complete